MTTIREIHGVRDAIKVAVSSGERQDVLVYDAGDRVLLSLTTSNYPAGLTPDQSDMLARQLRASARRCRAALATARQQEE